MTKRNDTAHAGSMQAVRWLCPQCGSDDLTVHYDERRASAVGTDPESDEPWPNFERDEFLTIDADSFTFTCGACFNCEFWPVRAQLPDA